ncbi:MAG: SDR family NAD(P)-dependent oxidoreductase, partial [Roseibium sp.]
ARPVEPSVVAGKDGALGVLFDAVASATGLPVHSLRPGDRFLDDLHLSSIAVAKVVSSAGRALGLSEFNGRMEFAGLTLAETAREITRVAALSPEDRPPEHRTSSGGDPDGVAPWTAFYSNRWIPVEEDALAPGAPVWSSEADPGEAVMLEVEADTDPATLARRLCVLMDKKVRHLAICTKSAVLGGLLKSFWLENDLASLRIWRSSDTGIARARFLSLSLPGFGTYRAGRNGLERQVFLRSFPEPVAPALGPQDVILFTGGAGGIGAECAQRLAGTFGASLILMGRSPVDSASVTAVLDRIARTGARVHYARADVTDASAVASALAEGEAVLGPITGIVHAAGANHPARFKDLSPAEFRQAHAAKVGGLENVLKAVNRRPLSLLAGFGSIISEIGLAGEAHYAWANACLGERIRAAKEEGAARHCVCFGWSVWAGAGMGQDLGVIDTLARKGVRALPLDDALDAFVEILSASPPEDPLVFVTGRFGQPGTVSLAGPDLAAHRFRDHRKVFYPGTEFICETELTAGRDPGLDGHRFDGIPVLPAVLGIEAMAAAAEAVGTTAPQQGTLENVEFHSAVTVPERGSRVLRIAALATTPEEVRLSLGCPDQDGNARPNMTATVVTCEEPPCAPEPAAGGVSLKASPLYGPVFFQSGPFARLDRIESLSARAVRASLTQPTGRIFGEYEPQGTLLPDRTAMDAGLHVLLATIPQRRVLPVAVQRIFWRKGGAPVEVRAVERKAPEGRYRFDVALVDEAGDPLEIWEGTDFVALSDCDFDRVPTALLPIAIEREAGDALRRFDLRIGLAKAEGRADARDEALAHVVGGPLAARLMRRADGKPVLPPGFGAVSLSHSARSCIAAFVDRDRVGIDVQSVEARDWSAVLAGPDLRFAEHLAEAGEALDFNTAATRIWCLREALFKAGIADRIQIVAGKGSSSPWFTATAGPARLASGNIGNGLECAVAIVAEKARLFTSHRPAGRKAKEQPVHGFS